MKFNKFDILLISDFEVGGVPSRLCDYLNKAEIKTFYVYLASKRNHDSNSYHLISQKEKVFKTCALKNNNRTHDLLVNNLRVFFIWIKLGFPKVYTYGGYHISFFLPIDSNFTYGTECDTYYQLKPKKIFNNFFTKDLKSSYKILKNFVIPLVYSLNFLKAKKIFIDSYFQKEIIRNYPHLSIFRKKFREIPHIDILEFTNGEKKKSPKNNYSFPKVDNNKLKILLPSRYQLNATGYSDHKGVDKILESINKIYKKRIDIEATIIRKGNFFNKKENEESIKNKYHFLKIIDPQPRYLYISKVLLNHDVIIDNISTPILNLCAIEGLLNNKIVISSTDPALYQLECYPPILRIQSEEDLIFTLQKLITSKIFVKEQYKNINNWKKEIYSKRDLFLNQIIKY